MWERQTESETEKQSGEGRENECVSCLFKSIELFQRSAHLVCLLALRYCRKSVLTWSFLLFWAQHWKTARIWSVQPPERSQETIETMPLPGTWYSKMIFKRNLISHLLYFRWQCRRKQLGCWDLLSAPCCLVVILLLRANREEWLEGDNAFSLTLLTSHLWESVWLWEKLKSSCRLFDHHRGSVWL